MQTTITITPILSLKDNYIWTLVDDQKKTAIMIDPGEAKPCFSFLAQQQLTLVGIFITHHHWDHTNGIEELKNRYDVPVLGPAIENVFAKSVSASEPQRVSVEPFPVTFDVLDIPGHTLGHIAYYATGMLFCGDTLFAAGCGRIFEGNPEQMYASLQKIASLPDDTHIYCAHEYTLANLRFAEVVEPANPAIATRIKAVKALREQHQPSLPSLLSEEKETNPFLRCDVPDVIASVEKYAGQKLTSPVEVFTWLRKWKDGF